MSWPSLASLKPQAWRSSLVSRHFRRPAEPGVEYGSVAVAALPAVAGGQRARERCVRSGRQAQMRRVAAARGAVACYGPHTRPAKQWPTRQRKEARTLRASADGVWIIYIACWAWHPRITEQHDACPGMRNRKNVRERHLCRSASWLQALFGHSAFGFHAAGRTHIADVHQTLRGRGALLRLHRVMTAWAANHGRFVSTVLHRISPRPQQLGPIELASCVVIVAH